MPGVVGRDREENERAWRVPIADIEATASTSTSAIRTGPDDLAHRPPAELIAELIENEREILGLLEELQARGVGGVTTVERVRVGDVSAFSAARSSIEPDDEYSLIGVYSFGKGIFHRDPKPGSELGDYGSSGSSRAIWSSATSRLGGRDRLCHRGDAGGRHASLPLLRPYDDRIDANWARWFFLSEPGMQLIRQAAPAPRSATGRSRLNGSRILSSSCHRSRNNVELPRILDRVVSQQLRIAGIRNDRQRLERGLADALVIRATTNARVARFGDVFELRRRQVDVEPDGELPRGRTALVRRRHLPQVPVIRR